MCVFSDKRTYKMDWLVVFYVPSTARSFRDGTPFTVPCEGHEARFLHRSRWGSNPGPSRGSPLHYHRATPTPFKMGSDCQPELFEIWTIFIIMGQFPVNTRKFKKYTNN